MKFTGARVPVVIERDADGLYTVECPLFRGNGKEFPVGGRGTFVTIPKHKKLGACLQRKILRDAGLTIEEFQKLL